ncbi:MAG TPA: hypothetical protein VGU74_05665, partial [Gemmatimonadales bacterium]|nr:hypothetical protein [Gemmatimonadales bacterium]
ELRLAIWLAGGEYNDVAQRGEPGVATRRYGGDARDFITVAGTEENEEEDGRQTDGTSLHNSPRDEG